MPTIEKSLKLTPVEQEIITLRAVLSMINDMVNHEVLAFHFHDPDSEVHFKTRIHQAFFNILLVDFLSVPKDFFSGEEAYLERLQRVCKDPKMNKESITKLGTSVNAFVDWLSQKVVVEKRWFPSLDLGLDLNIRRKDFITICGNISKHNFTQQTIQARKLQKVLVENDKSFAVDKCLIALDDFETQFSDDIFLYHSSTIAEFLNNIQWGIYEYVSMERQRSVRNFFDHRINRDSYTYDFPSGIVSDLGKNYYWELMNDVINPPFIPLFIVTKYLKMRY